MEENIKKILDQIQQHIVNCAFKDKSFFIRNDASIFIGQVKHLEFDLIRNQSH